jgi:hypothetical protein
MNADPVVMEHLPALLSREESDAMAGRIDKHFDEHGYGLWAVEVRGSFGGPRRQIGSDDGSSEEFWRQVPAESPGVLPSPDKSGGTLATRGVRPIASRDAAPGEEL